MSAALTTRILAASVDPATAQPPTVHERAVCGDRPGAVCLGVLRATHNDGLATFAQTWLAKPVKVVLILVVAFVLRAVVHRAINKLVERATEGSTTLAERARAHGGGRLLDVVDVAALTSERKRQRAETVGSVLRSVASIVIFGIAVITALGELGVNLAPIVASAGVVGVAVGFGAQNLVRDFISGVFMILEDQYGVGDVVDLGPASGNVEAVGLRVTRIRDVNGVVWHIRNGEINRVGNMSQQWSRALIDVPVAYSTDVPRARAVIKDVADSVRDDGAYADLILEEPEVWGVERLEADGVAIRLVVKTAPLQQWIVARALRERLMAAFAAEHIEIPLPQRSLWIRSTGEGAPDLAPGPRSPAGSAAPPNDEGAQLPEGAPGAEVGAAEQDG